MTQKSESVREAEQRELAEEMAHEAGITHRGTDLPREDVVELMIDFAKSTTIRLSKQAEQELGPALDEAFRHWAACDEKGEECGEWQAREAVAAWLREKAR